MRTLKTLYNEPSTLAVQSVQPPTIKVGNTPIEIALGIDEQGRTTSRRLYSFLELAQSQYSRWCRANITENEFAEENIDFIVLDINVENSKGGRPTQDYVLTAAFAKKLAMTSNNTKGEQAREYFIKVEEQLKKVVIASQEATNTMQPMQVIQQVNKIMLDEIVNLNEMQAKTRYNVGRAALIDLSNEIGAAVYVGKRRLYNRKKLDKYFDEIGDYKPNRWGRV